MLREVKNVAFAYLNEKTLNSLLFAVSMRSILFENGNAYVPNLLGSCPALDLFINGDNFSVG